MKDSNMFLHEEDGWESYEWESYAEFKPNFERIKQENPADYSYITRSRDSSPWEWYGHKAGFDGVLKCLDEGWPELVAKAQRMMDGIKLELPDHPTANHVRRRKRRFGDHGDELYMDRVWNGQLETAWSHPSRAEVIKQDAKRVNLFINLSTSWDVVNDDAMWRTALCVLLCDALAKAGRSFEVWAGSIVDNCFTNSRNRLTMGWCVKRSQDPVNIDKLAAMFSVGFGRTAAFVGRHCNGRPVNPNYGIPVYQDLLTKTLKDRAEAGETVLAIHQCLSKQQAIAEYARAMKSLDRAA